MRLRLNNKSPVVAQEQNRESRPHSGKDEQQLTITGSFPMAASS
jgi:hypothetical protein